jgi:hypothetical protein
VCGSTCTATQSDPNHCGTCENSCNGGGCNAGVCSPAPTAWLTNTYAALLAADDTALYYSGGPLLPQAIYKARFADGSTAQVLPAIPGDVARALQVNATEIAFTVSDTFGTEQLTLYTVPKTANSAWTQVASAQVTISPIAVDDSHAYFNAGSVGLVPDAGANNIFGSQGESPWAAVGVDATYVYWVDNFGTGSLWREAKSAPFDAPGTLIDTNVLPSTPWGPYNSTMAVTATDAFVASATAVYRVPLDGSGKKVIFSLGTQMNGLGQPVATGTDVYAVDATNGAMWRIPLSGAAPIEVGRASTGPVVTPKGIVWGDGETIRVYTP